MSIRRLFRYLVVLLSMGLVSFALGVVLGGKYGWLQPFVSITIVNSTGQKVTALQVTFKSAKSSGVVELPNLSEGARAVTRFFVYGDGEYTIHATLSDGTNVEARAGYVEPGYDVTEVLTTPGRTKTAPVR